MYEKGAGVLHAVSSTYLCLFDNLGLGNVFVSSIATPRRRSNIFLTAAGTFAQYVGAARTTVTQAAASPPKPALTGADPSPPGKPQEQTTVDDPTCRSGNKTTIKTQGQCI